MTGRARMPLQRMNVGDERGFLAAVPTAVQASARADDRFCVALADDKGLAAAPTRFRAPVRQIWRDFLHVTHPYE
jgi:hypothetical protein